MVLDAFGNLGIGNTAPQGVLDVSNYYGARQFLVANTVNSVNYVQVSGNTTGNAPTISVQGTDANTDFNIISKGTGVVNLNTGSGTQVRIIDSGGTAVNRIHLQGQATGFLPVIASRGSDTNLGMSYSTQGTGGHDFYTATTSFTQQFKIAHTTSAVNYVQVTGSVTGATPVISAQGSDATIALSIQPKGTNGYVNIGNQTNNYFQLYPNSGTGGPTFWTWGSDTDVPLNIATKGAGNINFKTNSGANNQFVIASTLSTVNYLQVTGNSTANTPVLSAQGSDANVSMSLIPKGVGSVLINQSYNQGTGILQANGSFSVAGNTITQNQYVSGNNNSLTYSQDFNNAVWGKTNLTVTTGFTAPDGTATAQKLVENNVTGQHLINQQNLTITPGTICTYSVYAKASEWTTFQLQSGSGGALGTFNLSSVTSVGSSGAINTTITSVGNGWYRCSLISFYGNGSQYIYKNSTSYAGDNVSGMFVWGSQLELGYIASAYTPTIAAVVTNTNNLYVYSGNVVVGNTSSYSTTNNAITVAGSIGTANSIYVGNRVGYANANNISVVYQSYNSSTNSLDVVFG
jgi:hypothetical protein